MQAPKQKLGIKISWGSGSYEDAVILAFNVFADIADGAWKSSAQKRTLFC